MCTVNRRWMLRGRSLPLHTHTHTTMYAQQACNKCPADGRDYIIVISPSHLDITRILSARTRTLTHSDREKKIYIIMLQYIIIKRVESRTATAVDNEKKKKKKYRGRVQRSFSYGVESNN